MINPSFCNIFSPSTTQLVFIVQLLGSVLLMNEFMSDVLSLLSDDEKVINEVQAEHQHVARPSGHCELIVRHGN